MDGRWEVHARSRTTRAKKMGGGSLEQYEKRRKKPWREELTATRCRSEGETTRFAGSQKRALMSRELKRTKKSRGIDFERERRERQRRKGRRYKDVERK